MAVDSAKWTRARRASIAATSLAIALVGIGSIAPSDAATLSSGCNTVNGASADGFYQNSSILPTIFFAGETITVTSGPPLTSTATSMFFRVNGIDVPGSPSPFPGTFSYTFPAGVSNTGVTWGLIGTGQATWTATCTGAVGPPCLPPPTGMKAWFPFDESSGPVTVNLRPPPPFAALVNGPQFVPGKVAAALKFDGVNDWVIAYPPEPDIALGNFSVDFWINTTSSSGTQAIFVKRTGSIGPFLKGYAVGLVNGRLMIQLADGSGTGGHTDYVGSPATFVADGTWHHVAITVQRSDQIRFYRDGVSISAVPAGNPGSLSNPGPLIFGKDLLSVMSHFGGTLDEVEIFGRVLTPTEVAQIFNSGSAGKCK